MSKTPKPYLNDTFIEFTATLIVNAEQPLQAKPETEILSGLISPAHRYRKRGAELQVLGHRCLLKCHVYLDIFYG